MNHPEDRSAQEVLVVLTGSLGGADTPAEGSALRLPAALTDGAKITVTAHQCEVIHPDTVSNSLLVAACQTAARHRRAAAELRADLIELGDRLIAVADSGELNGVASRPDLRWWTRNLAIAPDPAEDSGHHHPVAQAVHWGDIITGPHRRRLDQLATATGLNRQQVVEAIVETTLSSPARTRRLMDRLVHASTPAPAAMTGRPT